MGGGASGVAMKSTVVVLVKAAVGSVVLAERSSAMCMAMDKGVVMGKDGGRAVVWAAERAV